MSQLHTWPVVVAVVVTLAAACGGKSNDLQPAVGAAGATTGVTAGSGQGASGQGGSPASGAGGASTDGQAGSTSASGTDGDPIKCDPASAASCADGELIQCDASGSLKRTDCGAYAECSPVGGAHCELKDLPLAMKENDFGFTWRDAYAAALLRGARVRLPDQDHTVVPEPDRQQLGGQGHLTDRDVRDRG